MNSLFHKYLSIDLQYYQQLNYDTNIYQVIFIQVFIQGVDDHQIKAIIFIHFFIPL